MYLPATSSRRKINFRFLSFDTLWIAISPIIAFALRDPSYLQINQISYFSTPILAYAVVGFSINILTFIVMNVYETLDHVFTGKDALSVVLSCLISVVLTTFVFFVFTRLDGVPRTVPIIYGLVLVFGLLLYRLLHKEIYEKSSVIVNYPLTVDSNFLLKRVIIIGLDPFAISVIRTTEKQIPQTVQVIAAYSHNGKYNGRTISHVRIFDDITSLRSIVQEYLVHGILVSEIWISDSCLINQNSKQSIQQAVHECGVVSKKLSEALNLTSLETQNATKDLKPRNVERPNFIYWKIKRFLDVSVGVLLFISLSPIIIILVIITFKIYGMPIFFWQERIGRFGRRFRLYKIRTLGAPINKHGKLLNDEERLTEFGRILRRLRLDELPQLLSVINGDMSGIGPRPLLPRDQPRDSSIRLLVRPGITGWAQINGGELLSVDEKNLLDCWYVYNASLLLDIKIVVGSFKVLFLGVYKNHKALETARLWAQESSYISLDSRP